MNSNEPFVLLLHSHTRPTPREQELLAKARDKAGLDRKMLLRRAFAGCAGRVLAVGEAPDWIADYALIEDYDDPTLHKKLKWVILGDEVLGEIPGPTRKLDMLRGIFGEGVREIAE